MGRAVDVHGHCARRGARPGRARRGADIAQYLTNAPDVTEVVSAWTAPPQAAGGLISKDGKSGLVVAGISGGEKEAPQRAQALADAVSESVLREHPDVTVQAGGSAMVYAQINSQTERDVLLMESIAIPVSFAVLVWVFGGLLAAALPVVVGGLAIVGIAVGAAPDRDRHRRVDLRPEPDHRPGFGARHRLHAADRQPLPR